MELMLELRDVSVSWDDHMGRRMDVRVDIDSEDTVATLTEALVRSAEQQGWMLPSPRLGLARAADDHSADASAPGMVLDPAALVLDTGLVSGGAVRLVDTSTMAPPPVPGPPPAGVTLDVVAGPDAGRSIPLSLGQRVVVGREARGVGDKLERVEANLRMRTKQDAVAVPAGVVQKLKRVQSRMHGGQPVPDRSTFLLSDASLALKHFAVEAAGGQVVVTPLVTSADSDADGVTPAAGEGVTIGDGGPLAESSPWVPGERLHAGTSVFVVRETPQGETRRRDRLGQVSFNRVPYRRPMVIDQDLGDVGAPPGVPSKNSVSIAAALTPAMSAGSMAILMGNKYFLIMAGLTPLLFIWRGISSRRSGKKKFKRDRKAFYERVEAKAAELEEAVNAERDARLAAHPDLAELARQAAFHQPRLWERDRIAGDLLDLRLGLGEQPSKVSAGVGRTGDEALQAEGRERLANQSSVAGVPVTLDLARLGTVGVCGEPTQARALGRQLVAQAACLHSPEDVVVAAALGAGNLPEFDWLKWLPHVRSATSPLDGDHVAVGQDGTRSLLMNLLAVVSDRAERGSGRRGGAHWPRLLVLLDEAADADPSVLSQLLEVAPEHGIHVVWLGHSDLQVPRQCRAVVDCAGPDGQSRVRYADSAVAHQEVTLDTVRPETAGSIARSLAPLRDASASSLTTAIPRVVPLLDVVGMERPTQREVAGRWQAPKPYSLRFPVGLSAEGPFQLDLVEQGPHTLIGGTSGAGKSELLQTLVLSLAANYSPSEVNFLFVDYKGGASSSVFKDLPHTVGYVTNLSGRMSMRALVSLRAELQRRMQLMEGRAKDLAEMLTVAPEDAPPSLVIVVDEFAALVKEIPEFVAGMVDLAQRGRSLGIHLVLATQRPTGVVNENILANTNLRMSLRVLDPTDSNNIIGTRDAADIPVPLRGRAYARTGPQTLVPFQCAWSGAPFLVDMDQARTVTVERFAVHPGVPDGPLALPSASDEDAASTGASQPAAEPPTQLEVLVKACADAAREMELPPARRPWVEPLAEVIPLDDLLNVEDDEDQDSLLAELRTDPGRVAVLGRYDDPANQAQHTATVDLEASGGLMVFGTGGAGKSTLLRTVALGMARQGSADDVQIYAFDFGSRSLDVLDDLPHCATVVGGDDEELMTRVLTLLQTEIEVRRTALATARVENLGALRTRERTSVYPRIILLLDSYSGFYGAFDRPGMHGWLQTFQRVVSQGRQVGMHTVITNDRRGGVPTALMSGVSARLALRMSTADDLVALGVPNKVAKGAELTDGRGFLSGDVEIQVACVSADNSGAAQADMISRWAGELAAQHQARTPAPLALPEDLVLEQRGRSPLLAPLGVADLTLEPVEADLRRQNLAVVGPPLSGKSTVLETVAWGLRDSTPGITLAALGGPGSPLAGLDLWDETGFGQAAQARLVSRLSEELMADEGTEAKVVLFVDAAEDVDGKDVVRPMEVLAKRDCVRLVVACDGATLSKAFSGWLSALRRNRSVLVLQPEARTDVDSVAGVRPSLRPGQEFPPGRGVFVSNRRWQLVQAGRRASVRDRV